MLRFQLGKIPVTVHGSHLLIAALFGWMWVQNGISVGGEALALPGTPEYARVATLAVAGWMLNIFVSVLVHELGHALTSQAFGYSPAIHLAGLGGHTETHMAPDLAWYKRVAVVLAGPVAGALLGVLAGLVVMLFELPLMLEYLLGGLAFANFAWAILNLIPVPPLDGSQITTTVLMRMFGRRGFLFAQIVGVAVGVGVTLLCFKFNLGFIAILIFGIGTIHSVRAAAAYLRGEDEGAPAHPEPLEALNSAQEAFTAGDLDLTQTRAQAVLDAETPAAVQARAHYLLGWVSLRRKEGRAALDHFAQAGKTPVEPEALATAFTLIGDDHRASGLWELAFRERRTPASAQAWAASLLLQGQDVAASRVPGVDLSAAELIAARTAFGRGDFPTAARLATDSVERSPNDEAAYDAACAYAQAGDVAAALAMLEKARALGYSDVQHAAKDPDLAPLRGQPGFTSWLGGVDSPPV